VDWTGPNPRGYPKLPTLRRTLFGRTALHWAAQEGHRAVVELLLEKGADVEARDNDGRTALHFAESKGNKQRKEIQSPACFVAENRVTKTLSIQSELDIDPSYALNSVSPNLL
jgi:Ankyrin repeats (many copies)